jgi:LAS superfamily LD-carboxypeptidase LdcB
MASFAKFSEDVEREEKRKKSTAPMESKRTNPFDMSIKTEIDELHKIKEARDELQIMQQVSNIQETIKTSFRDNEGQRFSKQQDLIEQEIRELGKQQRQQQKQGNIISGDQAYVGSPLSSAYCN